MTSLAFIKLHNVSFGYRRNNPVIKKAELEINSGDFIAVTGPNGSGKTTLGKLIMGILKPVIGRVCIEGRDAAVMNPGEIGRRIGYLFQNPELQIFALTVMEELSFTLRIKNIDEDVIADRVDKILKLLHLEHHRNSPTFCLSYGEKQRLAIAGILINDPGFLILDEPTTGLDSLRVDILMSILGDLLKRGVGMMVISHDDIFVKNFRGRIFRMYGGEIFEEDNG